ncbi:sodium:solute symporter family protein [Komagataeibacter europaeus]|uniref:sodium:solute symporter family protein n=1 Tax=Komagataeibacter europaeus TaxID=33995 RepID=UPI0015F7BC31|nr:sodium:solute symporter [Komagataeibacter europaeus]
MEIVNFCLVILTALLIALCARLSIKTYDVKNFFVASGHFGRFLIFFLMIGETYSIGSVLGFPAGVYSKGEMFPLWFLGYILLSSCIGYFINPEILKIRDEYSCVTLADIFRKHFGSYVLEIIVVINSIMFLVPFGESQLIGILVVTKYMKFHIPTMLVAIISGLMTLLWVVFSGIRAPAYISIFKDILMVVSIVMGGVAALNLMDVPQPYLEHLVSSVVQPSYLSGSQDLFIVSTILLQGVGFCVAPQAVAFVFTARSEDTLRKNQIIMPFYMLMFPFLYLMSMYALRTHMALSSPNDVFMAVVSNTLSPGAQGLVAGGCVLSALVILSGICLTIGPLVSRNVLHASSGEWQSRGAKIVMAVYLMLSIVSLSFLSKYIIVLNNIYYFGISQTFPAIMLVIFRKKMPASLVGTGLVGGVLFSLLLYFSNIDTLGINPGFIGMIFNVSVLYFGSKLISRRSIYKSVLT